MPPALKWLLIVASLLVVALPRFNLHDPGPIGRFTASAAQSAYGRPIDVEGYIRLTDYFRGQAPADSMIPPFCYRPLVPYVASYLPIDSQSAINVVNLVCLLLAVFALDRLLLRLRLGDRARMIGCLLLTVSFPTFYYGAIGFIDPAALLVVTLASYVTVRGSWAALAAIVVLGVLVKETNALVALLPGVWAWANGERSPKIWARAAGQCLLAGITVVAVHALSPFPQQGAVWTPSAAALFENLARPRAVLSLLLTLGIPAVLAVAAVATNRAERALGRPVVRYLLGGCVLSAALYVASALAAYADGRIIW